MIFLKKLWQKGIENFKTVELRKMCSQFLVNFCFKFFFTNFFNNLKMAWIALMAPNSNKWLQMGPNGYIQLLIALVNYK